MTGEERYAEVLGQSGAWVLGETAGIHGFSKGWERVLTTTLSEGATVALAFGRALAGEKVVVELLDGDGLGRAAEALGEAWRIAAQEGFEVALVVRAPVPRHLPALSVPVWIAGVPKDLGVLLSEGLAMRRPMVLLASRSAREGEVAEGDVAEGQASKGQASTGEPSGKATAVVRREGSLLTVLASGDGVGTALLAAERVEGVEVIDLRGLGVFGDLRAGASQADGSRPEALRAVIGESVRKTGRVVVVGPGASALGVAVQEAFLRLESPPVALPDDIAVDVLVGHIENSINY